ncbi:hypothetical protein [uncultured Lactobacillus sp.]|uniref:hypothetical protein n=1 Tax=uncultured Lactobacillus sp. TaxID=153152 RepID=UPI00266675B3|nr:hypothetical protein [uncultured Lactobacillus sp.]
MEKQGMPVKPAQSRKASVLFGVQLLVNLYAGGHFGNLHLPVAETIVLLILLVAWSVFYKDLHQRVASKPLRLLLWTGQLLVNLYAASAFVANQVSSCFYSLSWSNVAEIIALLVFWTLALALSLHFDNHYEF